MQSTVQLSPHWVSHWQERLNEVVHCVQPWTTHAHGIPGTVRAHPMIRQLVQFMEDRVTQLTNRMSASLCSGRPVDGWTIACIERELAELQELARSLDDSLRRDRECLPLAG